MTEINQPSYLDLLQNGVLKQRVNEAWQQLKSCDVCAWKCGVNRMSGQMGICKTGEYARISSYGAHTGEEKPLSGWRGSGTIFFARCNLRCQYCQNYDISQYDAGGVIEPEELGVIMLKLQEYDCHNINFVSPSHVVPQILAGIFFAAKAGLNIPLVYNTGGYDSIESLSLLDGVIDIYMPDMKYSDPKIARKYSKIPYYPEINRRAIKEMHRQVGDLEINKNGLALRGLLVRHLVLPNNFAGTKAIMKFIANEISLNTYVNIMDQYHPSFQAHHYTELNRRISYAEYKNATRSALEVGLWRLDE